MTTYKPFFINGAFVDGTSTDKYDVYNPATDELIGSIKLAREHEVDLAVAAAREAFENGPWSTYSGSQRAACLFKLADLLMQPQNLEEYALAETRAMGQPIGFLKTIIAPTAADQIRYFAGWADKIEGQTYEEDNGNWRMTRYEPYGVCAGIVPWNVTILISVWKLAPGLAAGNTFVFKASEKSPFSSLVLARLVKEAGFPDGVLNIITGDGQTGALLASHMDIDKISFTGSGAAGRKVVDAANKSNLKKVTLELGGKSPSLVFDDADIPNALQGNSQGFLFNSGQACSAASRLFVHSAIADKFIDGLKTAFSGAEGLLGDPSNPATMLGPVADKAQLSRVLGFLEAGKADAKLLVGGERKGDTGAFIQPTVFLNPSKNSKIYKEEIFGPVLTVLTFDTEEEAIRLANDTAYGLSATIYTGSTSRALRVASKIKAGTISINAAFLPDKSTPFGGYKQSGNGRELGKEGLYAYLQSKTIKINLMV